MRAAIYLGDELTASGFRLAGVSVRVPGPGAELAELEAARAAAPLVLVSGSVAARIPGAALQHALRALAPLTVVVPDLREGCTFADVSGRLRRQLGIEA